MRVLLPAFVGRAICESLNISDRSAGPPKSRRAMRHSAIESTRQFVLCAFMQADIRIRLATSEDIPVLRELIAASVRGLQTEDYTPAQIEGALKTVFGVDSQLIADGTYLLAEIGPGAAERAEPRTGASNGMIVGCGGWRRPLDRTRGYAAGPAPRRGQDSRLFHPSRLGAAGNWQHDPESLRGCGQIRGVYALRNGRNADRRKALRRKRLCSCGIDRDSAGKRRIASGHSHGKTGLRRSLYGVPEEQVSPTIKLYLLQKNTPVLISAQQKFQQRLGRWKPIHAKR